MQFLVARRIDIDADLARNAMETSEADRPQTCHVMRPLSLATSKSTAYIMLLTAHGSYEHLNTSAHRRRDQALRAAGSPTPHQHATAGLRPERMACSDQQTLTTVSFVHHRESQCINMGDPRR